MFRIFLTHTPEILDLQFPAEARDRVSGHCEIVVNPTGQILSGAALAKATEGCDLVICDRQTACDSDFFDAAHNVLAVMRCAVDIRTIDIAAASRQGVLVTRSIPTFATSVSELALGMMIDGARGISQTVAAYRSGQEPVLTMGSQLSGQTLGICGFGVIGRHLAALGQALGMKVLVSDPASPQVPEGMSLTSFKILLGRSDVVVCLVPATPETHRMFNAAAFAGMQKHAMFLNLARAELVDETALENALDAGQIRVAAMDVGSFGDQRPAPHLARRADVIATPHIGGLTPQASLGQALHVAAQVAQLVSGDIPQEAVNAVDATRLKRRLASASEVGAAE